MHEFLQLSANGLVVGATYAAVAVGFALMFSSLKVINLTHPDLFMAAMFVGLVTSDNLVKTLVVVLLAACLFGIAGGLIIERVVIRPLAGREILTPMLATIGASFFIVYGVQALFGPDPVKFPSLLKFETTDVSSIQMNSLQLANLVIAGGVLAAGSLFVRRSKWGLAARAVAERRDVAAAFGVNVGRVGQVTVGVASAMAACAGIGVALLYGNAWAFIGQSFALKAFIAVLVAGNRHIEGVVAVAVALALLESYTTGYFSSAYQDIVGFALLLVILMFRPRGLFGSYAEERV